MPVVMIISCFLVEGPCSPGSRETRDTATRCSVLIDTRLIDIRVPQRATGTQASIAMIEHDRIWAQ